MAHTIFGHMRIADGDTVAAGLALEADQIRLATETAEIGSWPVDSVTFEPIDGRTIRITVNDDSVDFLAEDQVEALAFLEARRLGSSSLWIAAGSGVCRYPDRLRTRPGCGREWLPAVR